MNSRKEFENWFEADAMPLETNWFYRDEDFQEKYHLGFVQESWEIWQASREQMKKECIKACNNTELTFAWECAEAIEALE